jgi:hypothetical protein
MRSIKRWVVLGGLTLLAAALPSVAWAQGFQGQVTVLVEDEQGGIVPGASVTLRNDNTGETRTAITTGAGTATFPNLLVGSYTITVELTGFSKYERRGVQVRSNTTVDVPARLGVGTVGETITIMGGAELIKTTSSQLEGATFDAASLTKVPAYDPTLVGDITNFAVLAPGVGTQPGGVTGQGGVIGGNRPRNNSFVVDGLDNNEPDVTGAVAVPIQDSVEEFQLLTNQFSAEFGHSTAGQFITTTKSGTNEFHGGIWEYNINRHLLSLDNLTAAAAADDPNFEKPRFDRNRFGGALGGPLVEDKLFFYGAYEYRNLTQASTATSEILVPTAAGLEVLQGLAGTPGTGVSPITVGMLRDHLPPASSQSDVVFVTNEATGRLVPIPVGAFFASTPNFDREHVGQLNLDAQINANNRVSLRGYYSKLSTIDAGALPTEEFNSDVTGTTKRGTLSWVWTGRNNLISEFRSGYTDNVDDYPVALPSAPGTSDIFGNYILNDLGLEIGPLSNYPQSGSNSTFQVAETLTMIQGAHTFKAGAEFRGIQSSSQFLPRARGEYSYESLDEFVRDRVPGALALRGVGKEAFLGDRNAYYAFIQDSWKVSPRLTLDMGVRYEYTQTAKDSALQDLNALANVDIRNERDASGQVIFDTLTPAHRDLLLREFPDGTVTFQAPKADTNNFAPRVGFAWDIEGDATSSLRGGFAIAHDVYFGNLPLLQLPPQLQVETNSAIACSLSPAPAWCAVPVPSHSTIGFLAGGGLPASIDPTTSTDRDAARASTGAFVPSPEVIPETYTWSLAYQKQLWKDWVTELRYIGTAGRKLPVQRRKNAGIPDPVALPIFASRQEALSQNYAGAPTLADHLAARTPLLGAYGFLGAITSFDAVGESQYHGGSISVTRLFTNGLGFNVNYTLSRTEDNAENELFTSVLNPRRPDDYWDLDSNKGLSGLHKAHKVAANWAWEISRSKNKLLGGWTLSGAFIFETGQGLTVQSVRDQNGDFDATGDRAWLNANGDPKLGADSSFVCYVGGQAYISPTGCGGDAFVVGYVANDPNAAWVRGREGAQTGVGLSKSKRGDLIGPGNIHTLNIGLYKMIEFGSFNLRLGVTCANCTNTPSFALGTASGIAFNDAATTNRAYVTPATPNFLDETSFSGSMGAAPFQRIIALEAKLSF